MAWGMAVGWRRWWLLAAGVAAVTGVGTVAVLGGGAVRDWALGVLAAVVAGWLTTEIPRQVRSARAARAEEDPPVVVHLENRDGLLMEVDAAQGRQFVPASGHVLRLTVEATGEHTAVLRGLRALVVSSDEPPAGRLMVNAGIVEPRPFEVTLDAPRPRVLPVGEGVDFPFTVSRTDPEVIDVTAYTRTKDVRWRLALDWTCQGRSGSTPVDYAGHPIRTVPISEQD